MSSWPFDSHIIYAMLPHLGSPGFRLCSSSSRISTNRQFTSPNSAVFHNYNQCFNPRQSSSADYDWIYKLAMKAGIDFIYYTQLLIGRNCESPSDLMRRMRTMTPWNYLPDYILKSLLILAMPTVVQPSLMDYLPNFTPHQLAHIGDIVLDLTTLRNYKLNLRDRNSNIEFVVDTGSGHSIIPPQCIDMTAIEPILLWNMPKGRDINVYGYKSLIVDFGMEITFSWNFIIADVVQPLIGVDFLNYYDLQVDIKNKKLLKNQNPNFDVNIQNERNWPRANKLPFVIDRNTGLKFLVDSGAHRSQIPKNPQEDIVPLPLTRFVRANCTPICEYYYKELSVDFGFGESVSWHFLKNDLSAVLK
nr:gag pol polyprotein [Hymenolepis microstoma]